MKKAYLISGPRIASWMSSYLRNAHVRIIHMRRTYDKEALEVFNKQSSRRACNIATSRGEPVYCWVDAETQSMLWYTEADVIVANPNSSNMFMWAKDIEDMDLPEILDMHLATDISQMFLDCTFLKALDLSSWQPRKVKNIVSLFRNCRSLTKLNCRGWQLDSLETSLGALFCGCKSLKELDVTAWQFPNANSLYGTFMGCESLEEIPIDSWDLSKIGNYTKCFAGCRSLRGIPAKIRDSIASEGKAVESIRLVEAFADCHSLSDVDLTCPCPIDLYSAFSGCTGLKSVRVRSSSKELHLDHAFDGCKDLSKVEIKTTEPIREVLCSRAFSMCKELKELDLSGIAVTDEEVIQGWQGMVMGCTKLETVVFPKIAFGIKTRYNRSIVDEISGETSLPNLKWIIT